MAPSEGVTARRKKKKQDFDHLLDVVFELDRNDAITLRLALEQAGVGDVPSICTLSLECIEELTYISNGGDQEEVSPAPLPVGHKNLLRIFQEYMFEQQEIQMVSGKSLGLDPYDFDDFYMSRYLTRRKSGKLLYPEYVVAVLRQRCLSSIAETQRPTNTMKAKKVKKVEEPPASDKAIVTTKLSTFTEKAPDPSTSRPPFHQETACASPAKKENPLPNEVLLRVVTVWQGFPPEQSAVEDSHSPCCNIVTLTFPLLIQWKKKPKELAINPSGMRPPPLPGETPTGEFLVTLTTASGESRTTNILAGLLLLSFSVHHRQPQQFPTVTCGDRQGTTGHQGHPQPKQTVRVIRSPFLSARPECCKHSFPFFLHFRLSQQFLRSEFTVIMNAFTATNGEL